MAINRRQFVAASAAGLLVPAAPALAKPIDRELTGKTICGYQGWFNAKGDGHGLGFRHYQANGKFEPGHCTIDLWPDVSELSKAERFDTAFKHKSGKTAQVYSSAHPKTIARHFNWMQAHGIDGVAIQRFGTNLRTNSPIKRRILNHHNAVIKHARAAAKQAGRLWHVMYDLSSMKRGEPQELVAKDWKVLVEKQGVTDDPTYTRHNGKPVVALWGIGFSDGRKYTLADCAELIKRVSMGGKFSVMLGIPFHWREQGRDAVKDKSLHDVLRLGDILSPWSVGRFGDIESAIKRGRDTLEPDAAWCDRHGKHYLPVVFPGFSWHNLKKSKGLSSKLDQIPRRKGAFLWAQAEAARKAGAQSLYVAMFDEVDEGTAIFKCTNDPPIGKSPFLDYEGLPSDHYLWLAGKIAARLGKGKGPAISAMPKR